MELSLPLIAALVSLVASAVALGKIFFSINYAIASIQVKVDTMWLFTLRRGTGEAVMQGFATINSPIVFTVEAGEIINPMICTLQMLYHDLAPINDDDLAVEIEQAFGEQLLKDICIPNKMSMGACLVLAVAAAKGEVSAIHHIC